MADRESVFGDPRVQELIRERFVAAAADDWYERRRDDEVGRFFRAVADQGPRKGEGGATRQGRYVFTASGKLLGYNNNRGPERLIAMLERALDAWEALPAGEREPGAVEVPGLPGGRQDPRFVRVPPPGGLVAKVHTRTLAVEPGEDALEGGSDGRVQAVAPPAGDGGGRPRGAGAATDHLWVRADEWRDWLGRAAGAGAVTVPAPPAVARRIARFHLVDNTRGEPPHWRGDEIESVELVATAEPDGSVRIEGSFHLETADGGRGYQGQLLGSARLAGDPARGVAAFRLVALGDHWGEGRFTPGARPGRQPLGVVFSLADPEAPADRVPPQGSRWEGGYFDP